MLKKILVFGVVAMLFVSCKKEGYVCPYTDSSFVAPASEIAGLKGYIDANHPGAIQHSSGIYYEINTTGTGGSPDVCSSVNVKYTGKLINNVKFDENLTGTTFALGGLILGWQKGIPLIQKGGSINLYIPPSLGYGANANGSIPANSILVFTIQLVDFK